MLKFNLLNATRMRGIQSPVKFLKKAGIPYHSAHKIVNNSFGSINFKHLQSICIALNCQPNDLFVWENDTTHVLPEAHALTNLQASNSPINILEKLAALPINKLRDLEKVINDQTEPK